MSHRRGRKNMIDDSDDSSDDGLDLIMVNELHSHYLGKQPQRTSFLTGREYTWQLLEGHPTTMLDIKRMDATCFRSLVEELRRNNPNFERNHLPLEESLAIFLYTVGQPARLRNVVDRFQHSTETNDRHFKLMVRAIAGLAPAVIRPPNLNETPPEILHDPRYFPFFKDCVGAIDGTHISAWCPASKQRAFRGRKTAVTQNVMVICSFDMKFTFLMTGWEGIAHDSRIFLDAITRPDLQFPHPPTGKYYVADAGYANMPGYLSPHRSKRYHRSAFRLEGPHVGVDELFNYQHSSLRNVMERCFGILK